MAYMSDEPEEAPVFEGRGLEIYKDWVTDAEDAHNEARRLAHRDRDWYDNFDDSQWEEEEKHVLRKRGQPIVTMNRIKRKVNFLCGIEQKSRTDPRAYARRPNNADQAQVATDVLDYIENTIRFDKVASAAFKNLAIDGIQAVDVCYEQGRGAHGIVCKEIDYDQFFYDPRARQADFGDARYIGYHNWYDEEAALELFDTEEAEAAIRGSGNTEAVTGEGYDDKPNFWATSSGKRKRVRIACLYWKDGVSQWNYVYFCGGGILEEGVSTYLDENGRPDCPIIAGSAYVTRENERYGCVRDMISPQSEMNYRRSMALNLMKNRRVWSAQGVFSPTQNVKEEIARADGHLIANGQFGVEWGFMESSGEIAENFALLQDAKAEIDAQGPNAGLQGRGVENQSGVAIQAQQNAGLAEENTLFDTHNDWKLRVYRAFWARAKQFWTEEIWLRISDDDAEGGARFTALNQMAPPMMNGMGAPMPQGMPGMMPQPQVVNRIADMDVDIILTAAPDMLTLQHEQFGQLADMAGKGVPIPPDVLLEASSIRDKKKLIERIKQDLDLQAKLQQATEQMQQMQKAMQQMQAQLAQKPVTALEQAKIQEMGHRARIEERRLMIDEAEAGLDGARVRADLEVAQADIGLTRAKTVQTIAGVMRPAVQNLPKGQEPPPGV